jgi:hypothetical protein
MDEAPKFRVASGHIVPYVELKLGPTDIEYIVQGPGGFRGANARAVEQLAASRQFEGVTVRRSQVPIG